MPSDTNKPVDPELPVSEDIVTLHVNDPADAEAEAMLGAGFGDPLGPNFEKIAALFSAQNEKLEDEIKALKDRLIRTVAEMENVRKRAEREKQDISRYAITKFAQDVVQVADNFQRAIDSVPTESLESDTTLKTFVDGVVLTEREFLNVFERHGIRRIDPKGEKFDPNLHQAIAEFPYPDVPDGTIAEVAQTGYVIEDRVLRPAMVVVARGGGKPPKPANDEGPAAEATGEGQGI